MDRTSCKLFFCRISNSAQARLTFWVLYFVLSIKGKTLGTFSDCSLCCVCKSSMRSRGGSLHTYLGFQDSRLCQELGDQFSCRFKSLNIHKRVYLYLLGIQERSSLWTRSYHGVVVVSFLLEVAIGC